MTPNILIKSSSRAGRFKKKLVSLEVLEDQAEEIGARLAPVKILFQEQKISAAEFTALYLITILTVRFPGDWLGAKRPSLKLSHEMNLKIRDLPLVFEKNINRRLENIESLGELINNFAFKATPEAVNRSLLLWSIQEYKLELMSFIPGPLQVLKQQKIGHRCVTVLTEVGQLKRFILGERDALSFTMHDLIHADHFYKDNHCYQGQLAFYGFLDYCSNEKHFEALLENEKFKNEFEYLIADMNAYAIHLFKCLKSAMIHYHPLKDLFYHEWVLKVTTDKTVQKSLLELNQKDYNPEEQDQVILDYLQPFTSLLP